MKQHHLDMLSSLYDIQTKEVQTELAQKRSMISNIEEDKKQMMKILGQTSFDISDPQDRAFISRYIKGCHINKQKYEYDAEQINKEIESIQEKLFDAITEEEKLNILGKQLEKEKLELKKRAEEDFADLISNYMYFK